MSGDNTLFVQLTGRESKLLDMMREFTTKVDEGAAALAKERREALALEKEAAKALKTITSDQEKFNERVEHLNVLREKGKWTEEQYAAVVEKEFRKTSMYLDEVKRKREDERIALQKLMEQKEEDAANDKLRRSVLSSIATDQERYNEKISHYNDLLDRKIINEKEHARAVAKTRHEFEKTQMVEAELVEDTSLWQSLINDKLVVGLTKASLIVKGIEAAQQAVVSLVQEELSLRAQGGDKRVSLAGEIASLAQFDNAKELLAASKGFLSTGAFGDDAGKAIETIKTMQGSDLMGQQAQLQNLAASMLFGDNFNSFVASAGNFNRNFEGQLGDVNKIAGAALGASNLNPKEAQDLLGFAAESSGSLKAAGFTAQEALAMTDVISRTYANRTPEMLSSFAKKIATDEELRGKSPAEIVAAVNAEQLSNADLKVKFPDNAFEVFLKLRDSVEAVKSSEADIQRGIDEDLGVKAVDRAFSMNAGIRNTLQAVGVEAAARVFDQGEDSANFSRIFRESKRLIGSAAISAPETIASMYAPGVAQAAKDADMGQAVKILSSINNGIDKFNAEIRNRKSAAPTAKPEVEK